MKTLTDTQDWFLPGLPATLIRSFYEAAPGNEFGSGKFASPESSAALAANAFGFFLERPELVPAFPGADFPTWSPIVVRLEACLRFPWRGGRHPYLDATIDTHDALIGIESKRFEPFRDKHKVDFSAAYSRPVWGERMSRFGVVRDGLSSGALAYAYLDACQLVKHAFGLRSEIARIDAAKRPVLFYLFAEPKYGPSTGDISPEKHLAHRKEVADFAARVAGDEVEFLWCSYGELLEKWRRGGGELADHANALEARFSPA